MSKEKVKSEKRNDTKMMHELERINFEKSMIGEKVKSEKRNDTKVMHELERINFELSMIREQVEGLSYRKSLPKFRFYISHDVARTTLVILAFLVTIKYLFI